MVTLIPKICKTKTQELSQKTDSLQQNNTFLDCATSCPNEQIIKSIGYLE